MQPIRMRLIADGPAIAALLDLLESAGVDIIEVSQPYPARRSPGQQRVYVDLNIPSTSLD
ncbi:hypothetical protein [Haloglycomyces albus]|uniref:hypothetical protein n=1 Tax=Haloglycomyces albus TaxID=526067 RepID=UPI0012ECA035|nr:hypothetical protein [Haloglycomyces albus]